MDARRDVERRARAAESPRSHRVRLGRDADWRADRTTEPPLEPKQLVLWESIPSAPPASGNGGLLGSLSAQPGSPWLNMGLEPKDALPWLAAGRPIAPTPVPGLPAQTVPHLDSAKYWGAAPSRASAEPPASDNYLSPVPQAPSWDSMTAAPQLNDLDAPVPPPKYLDSPSSTSRTATISGLKCHVSGDKLTCVTPGGIQAVVSSSGPFSLTQDRSG